MGKAELNLKIHGTTQGFVKTSRMCGDNFFRGEMPSSNIKYEIFQSN